MTRIERINDEYCKDVITRIERNNDEDRQD